VNNNKFKSYLRRHTYLFPIILISVLSVINSCKKDGTKDKQKAVITDPSVLEAKSWYESVYPLNNNKQSTQSITTTLDFSQRIKPDWNHVVTYTRFDDDIIEMPLDSMTSAKMNLGLKNEKGDQVYNSAFSRSSFLLIKQLGKYNAYIMTIVADPAYLKGNLNKLDHNKYNKRDSDFSGVVLYSTPKGTFVNGWTYKNGVITGNISGGITSTGNNTTGGDQTTQSLNTNNNAQKITVCTEWYQTVTFNGTSYSSYLGESCVTFTAGGGGDGGGAPGGTGGGSGGGSGSSSPSQGTIPNPCVPTVLNNISNEQKTAVNSLQPQTAVTPIGGFPPPTGIPCPSTPKNTTVTNNVNNPCLKNMVNSTILSGVTNQINALISSVFGGSTTVNLTFTDTNSLPANFDGYTPPNGGIINGKLDVTVQLDVNHLPNYSQEYIARVIMHESLHAYLDARGISDQLQHEDIMVNYVTKMASSLQQMFPGLTNIDAKNLALGGLQGSPTFQSQIASDMGLDGTFVATNVAYSVGPSGTRCN
jgi:hypothetical protein